MNSEIYQKFRQADELLKEAKTVLVAAHENPDPDAVSSVLAMHYFFKKQNISSVPYLPDVPSKSLSYLTGFFEIKQEIDFSKPDVLVCLDYGDFKRLRIPESFCSAKIITVDHHVKSDQRGNVKILEPHSSSTAEIIYHWLRYKNIPIDKEMATCLLTGIVSDSGGFKHVSTSSQTLSIVSELLLKGVSLNKIIRQTLISDKSLNVSRAWGEVLSKTRIDPQVNLAYSWIGAGDFQRMGVKLADFDGITNIISASSMANLGLFLIEQEKGKVKGSLRSEPNSGRDVAVIARLLGGGGHPYAAGFQLEGTIEETLKKVLNLIR